MVALGGSSRSDGLIVKSVAIGLVFIFLLLTFFRGSGSTQSISFHSKKPTNNYAYAAFLAAPALVDEDAPDDEDVYFVGTRMLIYQILHDPATRTNNSYPFIVAVTEDVKQSKRRRLEADGAQVIQVEKLALKARTRKAWRDVLTKLRLFQLTQFDRVLFLDSDMLLAKPMDGIFEDPAGEVRYNKNITSSKAMPKDEPKQPASYVFASKSGSGGYNHTIPPPITRAINAGCVLFRPSQDLFEYYVALAQPEFESRYNGRYPEQGLWMYAHRMDGNMPWAHVDWHWNINWATQKDLEAGVASLHSKFWELDDFPELWDFAMSIKWRMEGFWEGRERRTSKRN